jgi:hypothetical protein
MEARTKILGIFVAVLFGFIPALGGATTSDHVTLARGGTVVCGGNIYTKEDVYTRWTIQNVNNHSAIKLVGMRIYNASGKAVFDSKTKGAPPSDTVVKFGVIEPHQTVVVHSNRLVEDKLIPGNLPNKQRPMVVEIDWASVSKAPVLTPYIYFSRTGPGAHRHSRDCRTIRLVGEK